MAENVDVVVAGAGVVGLAVARALALQGREVLLLERATAIGTATSARNSEVIHAGLYDDSGSLKARLCVGGRPLLDRYCAERGVAHRRCGKLVVATEPAQRSALDALARQAEANGVRTLQRLDGAAARALEPALRCEAALLSPATGIVDSHGLMLALLADVEAAGGVLALASPVQRIVLGAAADGRHRVEAADTVLAARCVVNAAGLWACAVAQATEGLTTAQRPPARFAKGNYFALAGRSPFGRLIYPLPEPGGLGIHLTLDLGGQARFGPDVEWIAPATPDAIDYRVDAGRVAAFEASIRRYWPALPDGALQPAYSGVRPKLAGPCEPPADFRIDGPAEHGVAGLVNLFGIESPGLTACLAIAQAVAAALS